MDATPNQLAAQLIETCNQFEWQPRTLRMMAVVEGESYQIDIKRVDPVERTG